MKMKLVLFVAGCLVFFCSCKSRPDQNLVNSMKADIAKYEAGPAAMAEFGKEMSEMGNIMLKLPADVKIKVPHFNEDEALSWKAIGSKYENGAKAYTQTVTDLKLLTADYMDGLIPTDSAQVRYKYLISGLESMPQPTRFAPDLNSARGSFQQMTSAIPDSIITEFKAEMAKQNKQ